MARNKGVALWRQQGSGDQDQRRGPQVGTYLAPWVTCAGMIPAGWLAHWWWGDAGVATGLAAAGILAAGAVVTWLDHKLTRARSWWAHDVSTVSVAAATVWLTTAVAAGPGRPVLDVLILGGVALATASNLHTWAAQQGSEEEDGRNQSGSRLPSWQEITQRIGALRGTRMRITEATDTRVEGVVQLEPGKHTVRDLSQNLDALASAYRLPAGAIRITPDPADASRARLTVVHQDVLRTPQPWPGLQHQGASIADAPLQLGVYEDGAELVVDPRNQHTLTAGMSGAGKSRYARVKMLQVAARRDAAVLAIDTEKGKQTLGPLLDPRAVAWAALSRAEAKAMVAGLYRAVYARADHLASRGMENWQPGCGLTWIYVLVEEAANVLDDIDNFTEFTRVARSAGIHIEVSLQRATYTNIDTDARANFGSAMCFGVRGSDDASYVLPDHVIEAGAAPDTWGKSKPGCVYPAVEGVDEERQAIPARIYDLPTDTLAAAVQQLPAPTFIDDVTRAAFGTAFETYHAQQAGPQRPAEPTPTPASDPAPQLESEQQQEEPVSPVPENTTRRDDPRDVEPIEFATPDDNPDIEGDIDALLPVEGKELTLGPRKHTSESALQARAAVTDQIQTWLEEGRTTFRGPQLGHALREEHGIQRSRAWVSGELRQRVESGQLSHEDSGEFTILHAGELAGV